MQSLGTKTWSTAADAEVTALDDESKYWANITSRSARRDQGSTLDRRKIRVRFSRLTVCEKTKLMRLFLRFP